MTHISGRLSGCVYVCIRCWGDCIYAITPVPLLPVSTSTSLSPISDGDRFITIYQYTAWLTCNLCLTMEKLAPSHCRKQTSCLSPSVSFLSKQTTCLCLHFRRSSNIVPMSDQYIYGQVCSRWAGLAVSLDLHHLVPALAPTESRHGYRDHHTFTTHSEHSSH